MADMKIGIHSAGHYDLAKMNKDQWIKFRCHFIEQRMYNPLLTANKNERAMDLILGALALIMSKKIPSELGLNKTDQMHLKIKVLPPFTGEDRPISAVLRLTPATRPISSRSGL